MTAFDHSLIAISCSGRQYTVSSQIAARMDTAALERDELLKDVSENTNYIDLVAILSKKDLPKYIIPNSDHRRDEATVWAHIHGSDVIFVVYHKAVI